MSEVSYADDEEFVTQNEEKEWLLYSVLLDGKGGGKSMSPSDINQWKPEDGVLWQHMDLSVAATHDWMLNKSGIDPLVLEALLEDEEPRPRCMPFGDNLLLF